MLPPVSFVIGDSHEIVHLVYLSPHRDHLENGHVTSIACYPPITFCPRTNAQQTSSSSSDGQGSGPATSMRHKLRKLREDSKLRKTDKNRNKTDEDKDNSFDLGGFFDSLGEVADSIEKNFDSNENGDKNDSRGVGDVFDSLGDVADSIEKIVDDSEDGNIHDSGDVPKWKRKRKWKRDVDNDIPKWKREKKWKRETDNDVPKWKKNKKWKRGKRVV